MPAAPIESSKLMIRLSPPQKNNKLVRRATPAWPHRRKWPECLHARHEIRLYWLSSSRGHAKARPYGRMRRHDGYESVTCDECRSH